MGFGESPLEALERTPVTLAANPLTPSRETSPHEKPSPAFWAGKSVFLTGHTGFKGCWLGLWLQRLGAKLHGYSLPPPTTPSLFEQAGISTHFETNQIGDISNYQALASAINTTSPDIVIHMAAQALVRASYANPIETFATNLMGTVHLLDAIRNTPSVRAVLIVTTDKVYENMDWAWGYREGDRLGGFDPYSASKACAELATAAFRNSYFHHANSENHLPFIATARAGNVIGGGDYAQDRLIPDFYRALSCGEAVHIRNPMATRPWQHVLEPLRGYLLYLESMMAQNRGKPSTALPTALNFGPNLQEAWNVSRVADRVCDIWGGNARWVQDPAIHPHEAHALCLDHSLAARTLHWHPVLSTEEALEDTVHWYKRAAHGESASALMHEQIDHYEKRIPARNISKH